MDEPRRQENKIRLERGQCNSPAVVSQNQGFFPKGCFNSFVFDIYKANIFFLLECFEG